MSDIKSGLYYTKEHEWLDVDGGMAAIGITSYASESLGDIVFAESEPVGTVLSPGAVCGVVESVKVASDIYCPVSGEIIEANDSLPDDPASLNADPYGTWICRVELSNPAELDGLMDAAAYGAFCDELKAKGM